MLAYTEHKATVKVAKFSPNMKWVASGDESGKVRIWAWTRADHLLKLEVEVLSGPVEDLCWDFENKRLFAVGGGASKAKFFMFDTGSNLGDVIPMSKKGLSCDLKPTRPFAAACAGEDFQLQFYLGGPPFKYSKAVTQHTNFVNCVRYSPDGSRFVSVSSDKQGLVYDGKTGDVIGSLDPSQQHSGSIYHCAWNTAGSQLVTSSADKSLKYWDMSTPGPLYPCIATASLGAGLGDMQLSVCWSPSLVLSLTLDGRLHVFAPLSPAPALTFDGHQSPMSAFAFDGPETLYSVCLGGKVMQWVPVAGRSDRFIAKSLAGESHAGKAVAVVVSGGEVSSIGWDDKLRVAQAGTGNFIASVAVGAQPRALAAIGSTRVVLTSSAIRVFIGTALASQLDTEFGPTCVSMFAGFGGVPECVAVCVGGDDSKLHLYTFTGTGTLTPVAESRAVGAAVSVVAFSPNGSVLATGDVTRDVRLFSGTDCSVLKSGLWQEHTTRVTSLAFSPSGRVFITVSSDRRICVWDPACDRVLKVIELAQAAPLSCVGWQSETTYWTLSTDGILKMWTLDV